MTRRSLAVFGRALVFLASLVCASAAADDLVATTEVGRVNGAVVTAGEFVDALRRGRFQGEAPDEARRTAWEACVRFKLIQLFARELGRLEEPSEKALREAWRLENQRRATADKRTLFGPRQLSWEQFRATWSDRIEREYGRRRLAERGRDVGERDEYAAFAAALEAARREASTSRNDAAIAQLEATTIFRAAAVSP